MSPGSSARAIREENPWTSRRFNEESAAPVTTTSAWPEAMSQCAAASAYAPEEQAVPTTNEGPANLNFRLTQAAGEFDMSRRIRCWSIPSAVPM